MNSHRFYQSGGKKIFGYMHSPKEKYPRNIGIVVCAPHAEEKLNSHRFLYNLSNELSKNGYHVIRFDYFGHGDSEGDFRDMTIQSMIDNTSTFINFFTERGIKQICLLGVRFGATIAALAAEENSRVKNLILINPFLQETCKTSIQK